MKKIIKTVIIIFLILLTIFFVYKKFLNGYLTRIFIESQIPKNITQTGAILTTPTAEEINKSNQLYGLLDMGIVTDKNFVLTPIPKKRRFVVGINSLDDITKQIFFDWLDNNSYESIPKEKFEFVLKNN
ncbi:MAG: hypothetical protein AAB778_01635 [Patescibacteria group bacterium]